MFQQQAEAALTEHERQTRSSKGSIWVQKVRLWGCGYVSPADSSGQCEDKWKTHLSVSLQRACTGSGVCPPVPSHWVNSGGTWHKLSQSLCITANRDWHAFHSTAPPPCQDPRLHSRNKSELRAEQPHQHAHAPPELRYKVNLRSTRKASYDLLGQAGKLWDGRRASGGCKLDQGPTHLRQTLVRIYSLCWCI